MRYLHGSDTQADSNKELSQLDIDIRRAGIRQQRCHHRGARLPAKHHRIEQGRPAALYLQLFDAAAVPSNATVPSLAPIVLAAGSTVRIALNDQSGNGYDGIAFVNGVCWAASTTAGTLTQDATSSVWVTARYIA